MADHAPPAPSGFVEVPHTADAALRVWGANLAELFANAARGLAWLLTDPQSIRPARRATLELRADDAETLLVTWLGELLYLYERDGAVFSEFEMEEVTPTCLRANARGGPAGEVRYHVKAVTFNQLAIRPTEKGWETTIVFDV